MTQEARLAVLLAQGSLSEDDCREIASMAAAARIVALAPGVSLPETAFAMPWKTRFLSIPKNEYLLRAISRTWRCGRR